MENKYLKVGETYNVRVKVIGIAKNGVDAIYVDDECIAGLHIGKRRVGILRPISPENGIKNTEPAPKYDPCRKFRKGDKVRLVPYRGRAPIMFGSNVFSIGEILTVEEDENKEYDVIVNGASHRQMCQACFLALVTPVEELEPYFIDQSTSKNYWEVFRRTAEEGNFLIASFHKNHPHAKAAAQAECDRLNAEHRKEQK